MIVAAYKFFKISCSPKKPTTTHTKKPGLQKFISNFAPLSQRIPLIVLMNIYYTKIEFLRRLKKKKISEEIDVCSYPYRASVWLFNVGRFCCKILYISQRIYNVSFTGICRKKMMLSCVKSHEQF